MTTTEPNVTEASTGVPFTLNGKEIIANEGELLIEACERNDVHIPRFCYHKRMEPVGMCRMCIVEVDTGRGPSLQPSCMLPVTPEMKVETESEVTKEAQDGVLELLLANHPLDCPVCDKGGECPLQDNAYAYGPGESRFVEEKRHFEKPIPISDLVHLDRERCILCDRCTRFASDVAGDALIHFIDRGSQTQVNTFPDHPFASYFSGNTVQICPVGALTASPYRFKARPWDLEATESTATTDSTGSRVILQSSQDKLVRILGVDSDAVNWGWLSDKERFIFEANNSEDRVTVPMMLNSGILKTARWNDAVSKAADLISQDPERIGVIGGARLTLESQFAWVKLLKENQGIANFDARLGDDISSSLATELNVATYDEAFAPGSVVVAITEDLKETLPTLYLRLRHAVVKDGVQLIEIGSKKTDLSALAKAHISVKPGELSNSVASILTGLEDGELSVASKLITSDKPVTVIFGRPNLAESQDYLNEAISSIYKAVPKVKYLPVFRRGNTMGAFAMGMSPVMGSGAKDTRAILEAAANGEIDTLVLLGADPVDDFYDYDLAKKAINQVDNIISIDCFMNNSSKYSSIFFPVAMLGEADGSFMNSEGRISPILARVTSPGQCRADWMIAEELAVAVSGSGIGCDSIESIRSQVADEFGSLDWQEVLTGADGVVVDLPKRATEIKIPYPDYVTNDSLSLVIGHKLWDQGTLVANSHSLSSLTDDFRIRVNPADVSRLELDKNKNVILSKGDISNEVPFVSDASVVEGTVWAPLNLPGCDIRKFVTAGEPICKVDITNSEESDG